jgi:transcriptional regulator with XRE-family HTH domain
MDWVAIGRNIQRWHQFKGKKQEPFAKEVDISRVMLSRYENGRSKISLEELEKIATALSITLPELLSVGDI